MAIEIFWSDIECLHSFTANECIDARVAIVMIESVGLHSVPGRNNDGAM